MCTTKESIQHARGFLFVENVGCWWEAKKEEVDIGGGWFLECCNTLVSSAPAAAALAHMAHFHMAHVHMAHIWHIYGTYACSQKNTLRTLQHRLSTVEVSEPMEMCTLGCTLYCTCVHVYMCTCANVHIRMNMSAQRPLAPTRWSKLRIKIWMITKR